MPTLNLDKEPDLLSVEII